jgi:hypothetical protein
MDYFALGGVLIKEEDVGTVFTKHEAFRSRWNLSAPLHSTKIRGKRGGFSWLKKVPERADQFFSDLDSLMVSLPFVAMACVIDRPGYVARYEGKHAEPWLLCKTAFSILVERSAKYAKSLDRRLVIYFEEAGKHEDRAIQSYARDLKTVGMPFEGAAQAGYKSLTAEDFRSLVQGEPNRITKAVPMVQFADLVLYALSKGGYAPDYAPFRALHDCGRILDALLPAKDLPQLGVKYSCFETTKARGAPSL